MQNPTNITSSETGDSVFENIYVTGKLNINTFYPPIVTTTQRDAMSVTAGAMVYNSSTNKLNFYNGSSWEAVTSS